MEKMKHKIRLTPSTDPDGHTDLPKKQAKVNGANSDSTSNSNTTQSSSAADGTTILPIVSQIHGKDDLQISKQTKEIHDVNMLETVRALLTCAVCLEVRNHSNQCVNGHLICSTCSIQLMQQTGNSRAKCPSCRTSLRSGLRRCLLAEQLADELPTLCHYCGQRMLHRLLHRHELDTCPKRPTFCRFNLVGCTWRGLGSEMNNHTSVCPHREKSIEEVEAVLVDNILRQIHNGSEERSFMNGILNQLKKAPCGLSIFRRQIGVFRDPPVLQSKIDMAPIYRYQSENYLLQCCGLRRIFTLVEIDFMRSKLEYRLLNRSEGKASLSFRLCLIRCGDLEFNVYDQVHCMNFDDTLKETPTYTATITFNACADNTYQNRRKLNNLIFNSDLSQLPPNLIQQSNALVLDFILLGLKRERVEFQFNESSLNDPSAIFNTGTTLMRHSTTDAALDSEENEINDLMTLDNEADSSYSSLRSSLGEIAHLPVGNRLRPLFNLIAPQDSADIANNNATIIQHGRPRTTVITVTNLSERIRPTLMPAAGEDDEDEDEAPDSDASTGEGNNEEVSDSSTDDEEDDNNPDNCVDPSTWDNDRQLADRNNNALTEDEEKDGCSPSNKYRKIITIDEDNVKEVKPDLSCVQACTCQCCSGSASKTNTNSEIVDQSRDIHEDTSLFDERNDERQPWTRSKRRISMSRSPMQNSCNMSSKRPRRASTPSKSRQPKPARHTRNSRSMLRRQSNQGFSYKNKIGSNKEQIPPFNGSEENVNDSCCKTPSWLQKLLQTMSQLTPYFIRNHLLVSPINSATPLTQTEAMITDNRIQSQLMSSANTLQSSKTQPLSLPMMSLRGDIPSEMMRWARTAARGLFSFRGSRVASSALIPNSLTATSSNGTSTETSVHVQHQPKDLSGGGEISTNGNCTSSNHINEGSRLTQRYRRTSANSKRKYQ